MLDLSGSFLSSKSVERDPTASRDPSLSAPLDWGRQTCWLVGWLIERDQIRSDKRQRRDEEKGKTHLSRKRRNSTSIDLIPWRLSMRTQTRFKDCGRGLESSVLLRFTSVPRDTTYWRVTVCHFSILSSGASAKPYLAIDRSIDQSVRRSVRVGEERRSGERKRVKRVAPRKIDEHQGREFDEMELLRFSWLVTHKHHVISLQIGEFVDQRAFPHV